VVNGTSLLEDDENTNKSFDEVAPGEHAFRFRNHEGESLGYVDDRSGTQASGAKI
jgi:hypothetical protein